ncbi:MULTISPECIES: tetratricopeptide repeat protein [unclassified Flavobacterium]|uniref:tetratricopeptide repeat protein n=1 Tax=unclassified Flavobacterium TaxID=196869 RepID=UPI0025C04A5F|nr:MULTISPECIES: tetratricopeptide repeat protein [unclassified Flavobacterium]
MQIIHKIDDFLFTIFPKLVGGGGNSLLISELEKYYTFGPFTPKVSITDDWVTIEIDTPTILAQEANYHKTVALCERGNYQEAKPILEKLIENNPTNSEFHRIMGQILSDQGNQEEAINCLIDALRWDSKNNWALLMMGNIFAKFKNDVPTAMRYYDQALVANPNDSITINNIGANLMQQGKLDEAKKYFWEAMKINSDYPNTHFALGMIAEMENDLQSAFYSTLQAIKCNKNKDVLYQNSFKQIFEISNRIITSDVGKKIFREYRHKLELEGGTDIDIIKDSEIPTAAKIEFAENYDRLKHLIRFKPNYPAVEHLIMHELVHLDFVIQARKAELNQLFTSTQQHRNAFIKTLQPSIIKLKKMAISEDAISNFCNGMFDGMNLQAYNTPIDLFIEDFLYNEFTELRPYQFVSLYALIQEGLKAVTDKSVIDLSPAMIISKSKIFNLVNALQFKALFGIDFIKDFNATPAELRKSEEFYIEFLEYKDNRKPGEEFELVLHWAEDLQIDQYFQLVNEKQYRKGSDIDSFMTNFGKDPFGVEEKDPFKEREMEKFQKTQEEIGLNMAVVMFMVDALQYFQDMPVDTIKKIAFEIAMQGTQGFDPNQKNYIIGSIANKRFSGYHILAYYYVSWMLALPEMVSQLQLPFDEEYKLATTMHKPK